MLSIKNLRAAIKEIDPQAQVSPHKDAAEWVTIYTHAALTQIQYALPGFGLQEKSVSRGGTIRRVRYAIIAQRIG